MKKRFIAIFIALALSISQTYAVSLNDLVGTAETKSSTWSSPMTGEKYFYSGSYEFTFNQTKNYAPWFNAGGSSDIFKAGCGGFSIGDMFLSMLGLNDIKDQLSNAGAQLAWGVMIGLVYTMPGIKDVFMSIQKWARAIQKLLQDACKIGQGLAKRSPFGNVVKNAENDLAQSDLGQAITNASTGIKGFFDTMSKYTDALNCSGLTGQSLEQCMNKTNKTIKNEVKKFVSSPAGTSLTSMVIGSSADTSVFSNNSYQGVFASKLSNYASNGKIGNVPITDANKLDDIKTTIFLMRLFFGDTGIAAKSITGLLSNTNCNSISDGMSCKVDIEKIKNKTIKTVMMGEEGNLDIQESNIAPVITDPKQVAKSFLNGLTAQSSNVDGACGNGYCYIRDDYIVYVNVPYSLSTGSSSSTATTSNANTSTPGIVQYVNFLGTVVNKDGNPGIKVEWDGAIKESFKSIKYYVKQKTGFSGNIGIFKDEHISGDSQGNIPIVIPGGGKYIDIIAKVEKKAGKETGYTASLKELLAKYNAYLFSKSFFGMIRAKIAEQMTDSATGANSLKLAEMNKQINAIYAQVQKEFSDIVKETNDFKTLADIFKSIDENYRQEISNSIR